MDKTLLGVDIDGCLTIDKDSDIKMPYSAVFLNKLRDFHNTEIYIVTERDPNMYFTTLNWLKDNDIPFSMYLVSENKGEIAEAFNLDAFVEDSPEQALDIAENDKLVFLMNHKYNEGVKHDNILRVDGWSEIYDYLSLEDGDLEGL